VSDTANTTTRPFPGGVSNKCARVLRRVLKDFLCSNSDFAKSGSQSETEAAETSVHAYIFKGGVSNFCPGRLARMVGNHLCISSIVCVWLTSLFDLQMVDSSAQGFSVAYGPLSLRQALQPFKTFSHTRRSSISVAMSSAEFRAKGAHQSTSRCLIFEANSQQNKCLF